MTVVWPDGSPSSFKPPVAPPYGGTRASSEYGMRWHPIDGVWRLHAGIDLIGFSTIVSPVDGEVTIAGWSGGYGNLVEVTASNGDTFRMAHNRSLSVRRGDRVRVGQAVAIMGTTGASTGVHSHFEVRPGGGATINPRDYMARQPVPGPSGGGSTPAVPIPEEKDDMARNAGVFYKRDGGKTVVYLLFNTDSGWFHEFGQGQNGGAMPGTYNNNLARALDTPSWAEVTEGHANVIKRGLVAVQPGNFPSDITVSLDQAEVKAAVGG